MELLCLPVEQQVYVAFQKPHNQDSWDWKCLTKKKHDDGWLFECQISEDTKPVCILHSADLASEPLLLVVKRIVHMLSRNPDQHILYIKEKWVANFQDVKSLLAMYRPEMRGFVTADEKILIRQALHLNRRDILDLRNLRDFIVLFFDKDGKMEEIGENMDKMSAITTIIDRKIWELGGEL